MNNEKETLSQNLKLTRFIRRAHIPVSAQRMVVEHGASPYVGGLPPQLCPLVPMEKRALVTTELNKHLDKLVADYFTVMAADDKECVIDLPQIGNLFGTPCNVVSPAFLPWGVRPWTGGFGAVVKVSFPQINVSYALKCFKDAKCPYFNHGGMFEIPTAFCANHAEPKYNCPVYMASLASAQQWMLSLWCGGDSGEIHESKNRIFYTDTAEMNDGNWRHGRRIDFGDTFLTDYGLQPYRIRKMYRQILWATEHGDKKTVQKLSGKSEFKNAVSLMQESERNLVNRYLANVR